MLKFFIHWLKANSVILLNASSLIGATAITSGLGFIYWWIAARQFPPEAIGMASASISAVMLLGTMSMFGLGTLLITELPRNPREAGSIMSTALLVVGLLGTLVGGVFALIASHSSAGFQPLGASPIDTLTFAVGVGFFAVTLVLDQALIGLLRGGLQFWRNTIFAILKLAALLVAYLWPSHQPGMKIYATWMVSSGLSLALFAVNVVLKKNWRSKNYWPRWQILRKLGLPAIQHHMLNLTLLAPTQLLPIVVTFMLSARMNAWFYVAWMIASVLFIVPGALTTVLHAINAAQQTTLARKARVTIGIALLVALLANLVILIGAQQILGIFGKEYANEAAWCLRILALTAFPLTIKNHYISICRIQDRIMTAMIAMIPGGLLELGAAALGAYTYGLLGLSLGWVLAIGVESVFMLPTVYKVIRPAQPYLARVQSAKTIIQPGNVWKVETIPLPRMDTLESLWLTKTVPLPVMPRGYSKDAGHSNDVRHSLSFRVNLVADPNVTEEGVV
ncbi:hypothetical protein KDH_60670 [Dictyobacter sp. S3.2.2.5]|uniref:Polysaccharide biosynthesis protein C-terminal domain-containing protein n=1 Tax=Dictyobacter halimunensis TaxID=3026934 RepID=A0ABQ6G350_9CHLR|nr:hypothetical protein KDH_60670 [Dictyobacter sp. S3.2.2.5]